MTLFTISSAWNDSVFLHEQLAFASSGDAILLLQDGVLALHSPINLASFLAKCTAQDITVYALQPDCKLRGIDNQYDQINLIDYSQFVSLFDVYSKQVAW